MTRRNLLESFGLTPLATIDGGREESSKRFWKLVSPLPSFVSDYSSDLIWVDLSGQVDGKSRILILPPCLPPTFLLWIDRKLVERTKLRLGMEYIADDICFRWNDDLGYYAIEFACAPPKGTEVGYLYDPH